MTKIHGIHGSVNMYGGLFIYSILAVYMHLHAPIRFPVETSIP